MAKIQTVRDFLTVLNTDASVFLLMRVTCIVFAIASICLLCRASTVQPYFYTDGRGQIYDMIPLAPLVYSLTWAIVSLILPGCRKKYHPGLDVALDLLACGILLSSGGVLLSWAMSTYEADTCQEMDPLECQDLAFHLSTTEKTASILIIVTGITHVAMFVQACRSVHVRRKQYVPSRDSFLRLEKTRSKEARRPSQDKNCSVLAATNGGSCI